MPSDLVPSLVRSLLEAPLGRKWSLQGFGMLRLYLSPNQRLHVWSDAHRVPDVSDVHDHPWHFRSDVISGLMRNQRLRSARPGEGESYQHARLRCGEGACLMASPCLAWLQSGPVEEYGPSESYAQRAHELHRSYPDAGTVTIITRAAAGDPDYAHVYWRGPEWVDAAPRPATDEEVTEICGLALKRWNGDGR